MTKPDATRIALLSAGVVLAMLACLAVGTLLERTIEADTSDAMPLEVREGPPASADLLGAPGALPHDETADPRP